MAYAPSFVKYEDQQQEAIDHPANNASPIQNQQSQSRTFISMDGEPEATMPAWFEDKSRRKKFVGNFLIAFGFRFGVFFCVIVAWLKWPQIGRDFFLTSEGQNLALVLIFLFVISGMSISYCGVGGGKPNPCNIMLFLISTVVPSICFAWTTDYFKWFSVVFAAATIAVVEYVLGMITLFTKIDITDKAMYILGAGLALLVFSLITTISVLMELIPWDTENQFQAFILAIFALLCILSHLYQLLLIVRGRSKYRYTEDDWLLASMGGKPGKQIR